MRRNDLLGKTAYFERRTRTTEVPNYGSAELRKCRSAKVPNGVKCENAKRRKERRCQTTLRANGAKQRVRHFPLLGSSALHAVRHSRSSALPLFGISAVRHLRRKRPSSAVRCSADSRRPVDARPALPQEQRVVRLFLRDRQIHVRPEVGSCFGRIRRLVRADGEHRVRRASVLPNQAPQIAEPITKNARPATYVRLMPKRSAMNAESGVLMPSAIT